MFMQDSLRALLCSVDSVWKGGSNSEVLRNIAIGKGQMLPCKGVTVDRAL